MPLPSPQPFSGAGSKSRGERTQVSTRTVLGLLALLAAVIALIFILSSGGSGDEGAPPPAVPADTEKPAGEKGDGSAQDGDSAGAGSDEQATDGEPTADDAPAADEEPTAEEEPVGDETDAGPVAMEPVPGADLGGGEVQISMSGSAARPELTIQLDGLPEPEGEYRGWLYDSVIDSRSLGRARSGDGVIAATLPEDWERYPFLDLSIQELDSIVHSGESIARIPVSDLPSP